MQTEPVTEPISSGQEKQPTEKASETGPDGQKINGEIHAPATTDANPQPSEGIGQDTQVPATTAEEATTTAVSQAPAAGSSEQTNLQ